MEISPIIFLGLHAGSSEQQRYFEIMIKGRKMRWVFYVISDYENNSVLPMPSAAVASSTEL